MSLDGSELPNPRELVCALHSDEYEIEPFVTHIFMQWGQFINHDLTSLSISRGDLSLTVKGQNFFNNFAFRLNK